MTTQRIVIAGGGTAGWMTAAAMSRFVPKSTEITLVESAAIGTVGVGEATIPPLADFNHMLGIDEHTFLAATGGTYKLGIDFLNWGDNGERYFHPFSAFGFDIEGIGFHQVWHWLQQQQHMPPLDAYTIGAQAAARERFIRPRTDDPRSPLAQMRHAYHIDAGRYATFLREYAEARGVTRLEGRIQTIEQHPEHGDIVALHLEQGVVVPGDFFVDCTGFRSLLIGQTLDSEWLDWSHWLPCARAVAVPSAPAPTLASHTQATALAAGWQWRIPLQHRTGNGHVYCSALMDEDLATAQLLDHLATAPTDSPRTLKFKTGRRQTLWENNCVAIGLSSGFVEPLESTSIHLIQEGISKLLALFPGQDDPAPQRHEYNQLMARLYDDIRDFVILHYTVNHRQDSPFWQQLATMALPDSLNERIDRFTPRGQWFAHRADLFTETSWVAVMMGPGLHPQGHRTLLGALERDTLANQFSDMAQVYQEASAHMPPHAAYINKFCAASDNAYLEHQR